MMAAMMLPAAAPAVLRRAQASGGVRAVPLFIGSYLAIWALVGAAVYALYRPHGSVAAGVVVIAAGVPLALASTGLGVLIVITPSLVPGLSPPM